MGCLKPTQRYFGLFAKAVLAILCFKKAMNVTEHWCFNYSIDGDTENFWELPGAEKVNGRVSAAFMLLFVVVGLPWNILVVITILWKKLYYQSTTMLLLNLVSADILLPGGLFARYHYYWDCWGIYYWAHKQDSLLHLLVYRIYSNSLHAGLSLCYSSDGH